MIEKTLSIIECILNGKTREEEIAEELGIKLNLVRKVLYKLYDAGVATYKRSKDPEHNGSLTVGNLMKKRYTK